MKRTYEDYKKIIEENLDKYLSIEDSPAKEIWESMRYSVLSPGKRLRPVMTVVTSEMFSNDYERAIPTACAIEMLHAQSLIHDDLPCMDNDDYRRGRLTNHKMFSESTAVLAGDALLSFAPQIIIHNNDFSKVSEKIVLEVLKEFFKTAGAFGLIAGQIADIKSQNCRNIDEKRLKFIHLHKTGDLFVLSLKAGAILAGAKREHIEVLQRFGEIFGIAFQIADDILDVIATEEDLGKTVGKDEKSGKLTAVKIYGLNGAKEVLKHRCESACEILKRNNIENEVLKCIVMDMYERVK